MSSMVFFKFNSLILIDLRLLSFKIHKNFPYFSGFLLGNELKNVLPKACVTIIRIFFPIDYLDKLIVLIDLFCFIMTHLNYR
jgi:hypothetical protein